MQRSIAIAALLGALAIEQPSGAQPPPAVTVATVSVQDVAPVSTYVGRVDAIQSVQIMARITAFLERIDFTEGGDVKIALWDLKGKLTGLPIYKLLGGAWRTALLFYASVGGNGDRSIDEVVRVVEARLRDKPAAVKVRFANNRTALDADIPGDITKARAVRKLVGDGFPLAFDANNCYTTGGAIRVGRALEDLGFWWFEEPVQHYHIHAIGEVARKLDITVSAGEQTYTLAALADLISAGVRMVQPDIVKMGGITGLLRCAALAHAHRVELVPHQTQPTIGHTANLHVVASLLQGTKPAEWNDPSARTHAVFENPPVPVDELFHLPAAPGLRLVVNDAAWAERRVPYAVVRDDA
jgi:L-alanine-DL-glutamate epimerase-like enolase superfamily enzyme